MVRKKIAILRSFNKCLTGGGKRNHSYIWRGKNTNASVVSQCGIRQSLVVYFALIVEFNSCKWCRANQ